MSYIRSKIYAIFALLNRFFSSTKMRLKRHKLSLPCFDRIFSLNYLISIGFLFSLISLIVALVYATLGMRETTELGERAIYEIVEQEKTARLILQQVAEIERKSKLFVLMDDPSLRQPYERQSYENVRSSLEQSLNKLLQLHVDNNVTLLATELLETEKLIYEQVVGSGADHDVRLPIEKAFKGLHLTANKLLKGVLAWIDMEVSELYAQSKSIRSRFLVKGVVLALFSAVIVLVLLVVVTRSIRQLNESIRSIGAGNLSAPISVTGPKELRQLGDQLEGMRERLLTLEQSKQQLIRNIFAQIEGPLARSCETSRALVESAAGETSADRMTVSKDLHSDLDKVKALFEELLSYSRASESPRQEGKQTVNVKNLLESVISTCQSSLQNKSLTIKKLMQPVKVLGRMAPLQTIVEHLLSNAIKFSPVGGEIRVILRTSGDYMELEVEDDGPGIEPDERNRVFEPFFRGKAACGNETEGTGMGLAIVKECLVTLQGKIDIVDPRQDQHGARIRVQIPLIEAE